ncbi:MAG: tRNA (guanosine(37)-N1)-methyltransferase TrmD, partial [Firmicutes bacterium]|nr:tRNA (guanosine(37)-N1)-methyltransferase TrmD [Bacillota bacterium]
MKIDILTLFPEMFAPLDHSMIRRGREAGLLDITVTNIRDFALDKHQTTDERLYGGGSGMVLKPDVLAAATRAVATDKRPRVLVTSPAGRP